MTTYSGTDEFEGHDLAFGSLFVKGVDVVPLVEAELVDAYVQEEWSLAQTLRHLVLATDAWLRGGILRVTRRSSSYVQSVSSS